MQKVFIAYFDLLGFKEFVNNNTDEHLKIRAEHIITNIESSLSLDVYELTSPVLAVPDIKQTPINCLNISDTVIFWTKDDSPESCLELCEVAHLFNSKMVVQDFPLRGTISYEKFEMNRGITTNSVGSCYSLNLMYGKGLINLHTNTESMEIAGTAIDQELIDKMKGNSKFQKFLEDKAIYHKIPYKAGLKDQYMLRLFSKPLQVDAYDDYKKQIFDNFEKDNKTIIPSVEKKRKNTLAFFELNVEQLPKDEKR